MFVSEVKYVEGNQPSLNMEQLLSVVDMTCSIRVLCIMTFYVYFDASRQLKLPTIDPEDYNVCLIYRSNSDHAYLRRSIHL
jgi:hypothetical protein